MTELWNQVDAALDAQTKAIEALGGTLDRLIVLMSRSSVEVEVPQCEVCGGRLVDVNRSPGGRDVAQMKLPTSPASVWAECTQCGERQTVNPRTIIPPKSGTAVVPARPFMSDEIPPGPSPNWRID